MTKVSLNLLGAIFSMSAKTDESVVFYFYNGVTKAKVFGYSFFYFTILARSHSPPFIVDFIRYIIKLLELTFIYHDKLSRLKATLLH